MVGTAWSHVQAWLLKKLLSPGEQYAWLWPTYSSPYPHRVSRIPSIVTLSKHCRLIIRMAIHICVQSTKWTVPHPRSKGAVHSVHSPLVSFCGGTGGMEADNSYSGQCDQRCHPLIDDVTSTDICWLYCRFLPRYLHALKAASAPPYTVDSNSNIREHWTGERQSLTIVRW